MAEETPLLPPAVAVVEKRFKDLLQRAAQVKSTDTVEPALSTADLGQDILSLDADLSKDATASQRQVILESAARKIFYQIVRSASIDEPKFVQTWNLLDILIICGEQDQASLIIPWYLIEELIESQTTDQCRIIFDYLESRRERLLQRDFPQTQLVVLRTCNELLRRLSRAEDAAFCGRVFFFLFQAFPLGDQSSVNLRGEYHVDNVTNFEQAEHSTAQELPQDMQLDTTVDGAELTPQPTSSDKPSSTPRASDADKESTEAAEQEADKLYPIFWRLQQDFSLPTRLFEDDNFETFKNGLDSTLARFKKTATVVQTRTVPDESRGVKRKMGSSGSSQYHRNYNPKYLTSRDLFMLELSDLSFQRHILVQALILIDFMLSLSEAAKKKIDLTSITKINRSVVYQYVLSDEKQRIISGMRAGIASYLQQGPDGNFYYRMVNTVLSRDKNWRQWKMAYCPPIVRDAVAPEQFIEARTQARQATASRRMRAKPMGAMDLTFLSQAEGAKGLEGLRDQSRFTAPTIEELVKGIGMDELDMEMANDEEKQMLETKKDSKAWRALRIASRTCLGKFDNVEPGKSLQAIFLQDESVDGGEDGRDAESFEKQTPEVQVV